MSLEVQGGDQLAALAKRFKGAPKELRSGFTKAITKAVVPLKKAAKRSAQDRLPGRGGLARRVAKTTLRHKRRAGASAGIRIEANTNAVKDPLRLDRGRAKHPTYGHKPWVLQDVRKGWFTDPMQEGAPLVRRELTTVMDDIARQIEG